MKIEELQQRSREHAKKLQEHYQFKDEMTMALAHLAKLTEEVGELSEKILGRFGLQRESKLAEAQKDLPEEIADVIYTTTTIAESLGVDFREALEKKMKKIDERGMK